MQIDFTIDGETPDIAVHGMNAGNLRYCIRSKERRNEGIYLNEDGKWEYVPSWSKVMGLRTVDEAVAFAAKHATGKFTLFNKLFAATTAKTKPPRHGCSESELLTHKANHPSTISPEILGKVETVMRELRNDIHPPIFKRIADSLGEI